jgi:cytochrome c-type biogenesis protein CcmH
VSRIFISLCLVFSAFAMPAHAVEQAASPDSGVAATHAKLDPAMARRLKTLETELRCLVCQNQTLADSEAGLAQDLRNQIEQLALEGKSDEEIKLWLQARYGDFVLYRPPVKPQTWFLWFGPFVLLLAALAFWMWRLASRRVEPRADEPAAEEFEHVLEAATKSS